MVNLRLGIPQTGATRIETNFSRGGERIDIMVEKKRVSDEITDEEFDEAMEKVLREDKTLLERLAKI